jgi:hypothetical protein
MIHRMKWGSSDKLVTKYLTPFFYLYAANQHIIGKMDAAENDEAKVRYEKIVGRGLNPERATLGAGLLDMFGRMKSGSLAEAAMPPLLKPL